MVTVMRPLSTSELLDRTFHLYRNNFLVFVGIAAIPQLAVLVLQLADAMMRSHGFFFGASATAIIAGLASFIAIEVSQAATVMAVSNLHLDRTASIGAAYSSAKGSLLRVIGISLAIIAIPAGIAVLIAVPILILGRIIFSRALRVSAFPAAAGLVIDNISLIRLSSLAIALVVSLLALRWWLRWSLAVPVTVLEGCGVRASMRRSKALTKGSRGRILLVYLLMLALTWIVSTVIQLPFLLTSGLRALRDPANVGPAANALLAAGGFLSTSLVGPLLTIALTLIYYDQRVRKEGFDLQLMMATLQTGSPAATVTNT